MGIAKAVTRACSVKGVPSMCDYSLHLGRIPTRQSRLANGRDALAVRLRAAVVVEVCRHRRDDTLPAHEAGHLSAALRPSDRPPDAGGRAARRGARSRKAYIAGIFEHPTRKADDKSLAQLHAEAATGALRDAGLTRADVDGYFCAGDAPGLGGLSMADYMGLKVRHIDTTESGGSSYVIHVAHAAEAI